jgi:hypothetical protein
MLWGEEVIDKDIVFENRLHTPNETITLRIIITIIHQLKFPVLKYSP